MRNVLKYPASNLLSLFDTERLQDLEDFKQSFSEAEGGTWEFADKDADDMPCWGEFPLLEVQISRVLIEARAR